MLFYRTFFLLAILFFFFFNDTATTEIYTLSLHDALPISRWARRSERSRACAARASSTPRGSATPRDRKSTRLNSRHANLVCRLLLEKKKRRGLVGLLDQQIGIVVAGQHQEMQLR